MPSIRRFRPHIGQQYEEDEVALVACDPYVVLGHVKVRSLPRLSLADDPQQNHILVEPHVPLDGSISSLPVSETVKKALFTSNNSSVFTGLDGVKYLKFQKEAALRKGGYVFLTICSFNSDDIQHPNAEFLTWTPEKELVQYEGGKEACLAYVEINNLTPTAQLKRLKDGYSAAAIKRILDVHSQRMRAAHRLLNDAATFVPYTGNSYVLGKGNIGNRRNLTSAQRERAVRVLHQQFTLTKRDLVSRAQRKRKDKKKKVAAPRPRTRAERLRARTRAKARAR